MVNQGLTIVAVLLVGAALILLVWGVFSVLPPASRLITKSFWCPFRKRRVTTEFKEEAWGGTRLRLEELPE